MLKDQGRKTNPEQNQSKKEQGLCKARFLTIVCDGLVLNQPLLYSVQQCTTERDISQISTQLVNSIFSCYLFQLDSYTQYYECLVVGIVLGILGVLIIYWNCNCQAQRQALKKRARCQHCYGTLSGLCKALICNV